MWNEHVFVNRHIVFTLQIPATTDDGEIREKLSKHVPVACLFIFVLLLFISGTPSFAGCTEKCTKLVVVHLYCCLFYTKIESLYRARVRGRHTAHTQVRGMCVSWLFLIFNGKLKLPSIAFRSNEFDTAISLALLRFRCAMAVHFISKSFFRFSILSPNPWAMVLAASESLERLDW